MSLLDSVHQFFRIGSVLGEKAAKLVLQMDIGALYDDLALRLHNNKRPAYAGTV